MLQTYDDNAGYKKVVIWEWTNSEMSCHNIWCGEWKPNFFKQTVVYNVFVWEKGSKVNPKAIFTLTTYLGWEINEGATAQLQQKPSQKMSPVNHKILQPAVLVGLHFEFQRP